MRVGNYARRLLEQKAHLSKIVFLFALFLHVTAGLTQSVAQGLITREITQAPYADLAQRSESLDPNQKQQAQRLFSTGFTLWQSGNCDATAMAFKEGLDIDPANPQAIYYYGDCLRRLRNRKEAAEYFNRAAALGSNTPEGFKARAAQKDFQKPVPISEMLLDELTELYVGTWYDNNNDSFAFVISKNRDGKLVISGRARCLFCDDDTQYINITLDEKGAIRFNYKNETFSFITVWWPQIDLREPLPGLRPL